MQKPTVFLILTRIWPSKLLLCFSSCIQRATSANVCALLWHFLKFLWTLERVTNHCAEPVQMKSMEKKYALFAFQNGNFSDTLDESSCNDRVPNRNDYWDSETFTSRAGRRLHSFPRIVAYWVSTSLFWTKSDH